MWGHRMPLCASRLLTGANITELPNVDEMLINSANLPDAKL